MELHYGRVTSKGQITIPAAIRRRLALDTGASVLFTVTTEGRVVVSSPAKDVMAAFGSMSLPPGMTAEKLSAMADEIGTAEAVKHHLRSMSDEDEVEEAVEHELLPAAR